MVRTVNPQIGSILNHEIEIMAGSSQNDLSPRGVLERINEQAQTLLAALAERDVADREVSHADSPPSYDSLTPLNQYSRSPVHSTEHERAPQDTTTQPTQAIGIDPSHVVVVDNGTPPPLTGIDACIDRLIRNPPLRQRTKKGLDTLIFIDRLCLQNRDLEDRLQEEFSNRPIFVERSKLQALNSPYFNKCLNPFYQTRKWKSLSAKIALYQLPEGIKYVINMTPDNEGPEAVQAIQDLSCPFGVLHWKKSQHRWGIRNSLVGGKDENDIEQERDATAMEYSLVRHVRSIERFMAALQGHDPQFDSAPKLYSAVMVSKAWGIQGQHPLIDYAARWLCDSEANAKFVEAYPEVVLKMADVLKCAPVCKDAFSVLVGEAALDTSLTKGPDNHKTVYERIRGDIEEDWLSRVQHARNSFVDRVKTVFESLAGENMEWISNLPPVRNIQLKARLSKGNKSQSDRFLALLKRFIRGAIYRLLCDDYEDMTTARDQLSSLGDCLYPREIEKKVWGSLRATERVFTIRFWQILSGCYVQRYHETRFNNWAMIVSHYTSRGMSPICTEYAGGHLLEAISVADLISALPDSSQLRKPARSAIVKSVTTQTNSVNSTSVSFRPRTDHFPSVSGNPIAPMPWEHEISEDAVQAGFTPTRNLTLPEKPNDSSLGYALMFGNCSSPGCTNRYYALSVSSFCDRCRQQYCVDHIDQDEHDCNPVRRELSPVTQQDPLGAIPVRPATENTNDTIEQASRDEEEEWDNQQKRYALPLIGDILKSATQHISTVGRMMLCNVPGGNLGPVDDTNRITHTLACLSEEELKYLPLWAEGLDDGTGGVFGDHIPAASEDSAGLGPGGRRLASRSEGSNYSFVSGTADSTVNTSTIAHDGYRDTLPRGHVVAMDDVESSSEGGWSYIQDTIDNGKGKARAFTPEASSEIASTLGGLDAASVIDLGIQSGTDSFDQLDSDMDVESIGSSDVSSPRTIGGAEGDDEILDDYEGDDDSGPDDLDEDEDMDMMFEDDLPQTLVTRRASTLAQQPALTPSAQNIPAADLLEQKSMTHISYVYKDDSDHDLMTRP